MDQDQDDARGFVPQNGCGLLGLPKRAPDLEKWQETNTHWTDYIWQTLGLCHRAVNIGGPGRAWLEDGRWWSPCRF
jgi:hypothetical protein